MKYEAISRHATALVGLGGALLILGGMFWVINSCRSAAFRLPLDSRRQSPVFAAELLTDYEDPWVPGLLPDLAVVNAYTCQLNITTTDHAPLNNLSFDTAAAIDNYWDQALISGTHYPDEVVETRSDFYRKDNADIGTTYTVQAKPDGTINYSLGIVVYDSDRTPIITDTEAFDNPYARVTLLADTIGPYYFEVFQISESCDGGTYSLILGKTEPTPTPSPTATALPGPTATPQPGSTWMTGFDQYEPNFDFNIATTIAPGIIYSMNFVPWGGGDVDNDFLKIRVKPGLQLTCETSDLDPAVDPRMVFYSGPSEQTYVMANDDIGLGDFNSRLSYYATYEGYVYILIGQGSRMASRDTVNSDYSVTCDLSVPGDVTPQPGQTPIPDKDTPAPAPTPTPQTSVVATPTPPPVVEEDVELTFRLVTRPEPRTVTPEPGGFRTFRVIAYFDADQDGVMGAGEGVTGFFVQVLSPDGQRELAQGYTDDQGQLSFTVPTIGTVRVILPLLGVDRLIEASKPEVRVKIAPPSLPDTLP